MRPFGPSASPPTGRHGGTSSERRVEASSERVQVTSETSSRPFSSCAQVCGLHTALYFSVLTGDAALAPVLSRGRGLARGAAAPAARPSAQGLELDHRRPRAAGPWWQSELSALWRGGGKPGARRQGQPGGTRLAQDDRAVDRSHRSRHRGRDRTCPAECLVLACPRAHMLAQPGSTAPISPPRPSSLPRLTPSPAGVTVLRCERHEEVADHVLACEQRAAEDGAASAAQLMPDEVDDVTEGVHAHLGEVWGADKHHVRPRERPVRSPKPRWLRKRAPAPLSCAQIAFLLATKPLAALARVRNEEDWHALLYETKVCPHHTGPRSLPTPSHAARAAARALSTQSCSTLRSTGCSETGHSSERARRVRGRGFGPW